MKNYEQIMELVGEVNKLIDTTNAKTKEMNDAIVNVKVNAYNKILDNIREIQTAMRKIGTREKFWYDTEINWPKMYEDYDFLFGTFSPLVHIMLKVDRRGAYIYIGKEHCEDNVPTRYGDYFLCNYLIDNLDLSDLEEKFTIWVAEQLKEKAEKANEEYAEAKAKFEEVFG